MKGCRRSRCRKAATTSGLGQGVDRKELRTQGDIPQPPFCPHPKAVVQNFSSRVWLPRTAT